MNFFVFVLFHRAQKVIGPTWPTEQARGPWLLPTITHTVVSGGDATSHNFFLAERTTPTVQKVEKCYERVFENTFAG